MKPRFPIPNQAWTQLSSGLEAHTDIPLRRPIFKSDTHLSLQLSSSLPMVRFLRLSLTCLLLAVVGSCSGDVYLRSTTDTVSRHHGTTKEANATVDLGQQHQGNSKSIRRLEEGNRSTNNDAQTPDFLIIEDHAGPQFTLDQNDVTAGAIAFVSTLRDALANLIQSGRHKINDWEGCTVHSDCVNNCCSTKLSNDGHFMCLPTAQCS